MLFLKKIMGNSLMKLLFKMMNGTPPQGKVVLWQFTDKARKLKTDLLFIKILPLLMQLILEDQERRLLMKIIDQVLYKLDELARLLVYKILIIVEQLLINDDYYAHVEGRDHFHQIIQLHVENCAQ